MSSPNYEVVALDTGVAELAGKIRAETGLRLPDSVIMASGIKAGADCIVTEDNEFMKSKHLKSLTPSEFMTKYK